jgi:hypothetical protein
VPKLWRDIYGGRLCWCGPGHGDGMCRLCYEESNEQYVERMLEKFSNVWYRPDSDKYEICVYTPDGDRRYYRQNLHAVQRIESWYDE